MARQPRQESATGYYHVMMRGITGDSIFAPEADKLHFLELIRLQQSVGLVTLVAWCVMDTHVHLLVKADKGALSRAAKVINIKYAAYYNRNHMRRGPVFGGRFRSERVEDDRYLLGAVRYIHNNPVKAGLVQFASEYKWSSFREYVHSATYLDPIERTFVLDLIGHDPAKFAAFHAQTDETDYLEVRDDILRIREERAAKVLEQFCRQHGITKGADLRRHPVLFEELCRLLVQDVGLSLRRAAEYLETTHSRVYQALSERE